MTLEEYLRAHLNDVVNISGYTCAAKNRVKDQVVDLRYVLPMAMVKDVRFYAPEGKYAAIRESGKTEVEVDDLGDIYIGGWEPRVKLHPSGNWPLSHLPLGAQAALVEALEREGKLE